MRAGRTTATAAAPFRMHVRLSCAGLLWLALSLVCVALGTGVVAWENTLPYYGEYNFAAATDGTSYVTNVQIVYEKPHFSYPRGDVYCFAPNGTQVWTWQISPYVEANEAAISAPVLDARRQLLYVRQYFTVFALSTDTGRVQWMLEYADPKQVMQFCVPVMTPDGSQLIVNSLDGYAFIDLDQHKVVNTLPTLLNATQMFSPMFGSDGSLFAGLQWDGPHFQQLRVGVARFTADGQVLWLRTWDVPAGYAMFAGMRAVLRDNSALITSNGMDVIRVDTQGQTMWSNKNATYEMGSIAVNETAGRVYAQGSEGETSAFITVDLATGELVHAERMGGNLETQLQPQQARGHVYHLAWGRLWTLDPVSGKVLDSRGVYNYNWFQGPRFALQGNLALFLTSLYSTDQMNGVTF